MITVIIASSNEEKTIGKAIECISDSSYTNYKGKLQMIQVSPDEETLEAGSNTARRLNLGTNYQQIKDPKKGKSTALNLALKEAKGEIIVMTDGDVYLDKNALGELITCFSDEHIGGVSGKPIPQNSRNTFWGYIAHLLTAAADHKRRSIFPNKVDRYFTKKGSYFPMSGYILAFRNIDLQYDSQYIDDALISIKILKKGLDLAYAPEAKVIVKFPENMKDYLIQRRRNFLGNREIHKDERFYEYSDPRSFKNELKYALFPLYFAKNIKEFIWSLFLYPIRSVTWLICLVPSKKSKTKIWKTASSTK